MDTQQKTITRPIRVAEDVWQMLWALKFMNGVDMGSFATERLRAAIQAEFDALPKAVRDRAMKVSKN